MLHAHMMRVMSTEVLATLRAGVGIPYGERRVTESASQVYFEGTHSVVLLRTGVSHSSVRFIPEGRIR